MKTKTITIFSGRKSMVEYPDRVFWRIADAVINQGKANAAFIRG